MPPSANPKFNDLRDFISTLEQRRLLHRIGVEVDPYLEITEVCDRTLRAAGPALLFEHPTGHSIALLANLFGTVERIALAMGAESVAALRDIGNLLALLRQPEPPAGMKAALRMLPTLGKVLDMAPKQRREGVCQEVVLEGDAVDLRALPIQTCWPEDAAALITWGLVVTYGPERQRTNLGIYRQQVIDHKRLIMRWLAQRGGALDYRAWCAQTPRQKFPVAVVLGADPAITLAAVTPIPDTLSEYAFAGLLRGGRTELTPCIGIDHLVPAHAEIILEGHIYPGDQANEGPFGDHTGYYNEVQAIPGADH